MHQSKEMREVIERFFLLSLEVGKKNRDAPLRGSTAAPSEGKKEMRKALSKKGKESAPLRSKISNRTKRKNERGGLKCGFFVNSGVQGATTTLEDKNSCSRTLKEE